MAGLAKGLAIIEAFGRHSSLSIAEAARCSSSSRAAARRCLLTLKSLGYVELIGQRYTPSAKLNGLGRTDDPRQVLAALAQPYLESARDRLDESVSLAVLDDDGSLFIARAEADHIVSIGVRIGAILPAYCSATGRVLLGVHDREAIGRIIGRGPFAKRTARTRTATSEIVAAITQARRSGFSLNDQELEIGMRSLAVPVQGADGRVVAAVSVSTASVRSKLPELERECLPTLIATAKSIGAALQAHVRPA